MSSEVVSVGARPMNQLSSTVVSDSHQMFTHASRSMAVLVALM
jgi:hypothetical protein